MVSQDISDILNIIICPKCKNKITLGLDNNKLECTHCKIYYSIEEEIPILLIDKVEPFK